MFCHLRCRSAIERAGRRYVLQGARSGGPSRKQWPSVSRNETQRKIVREEHAVPAAVAEEHPIWRFRGALPSDVCCQSAVACSILPAIQATAKLCSRPGLSRERFLSTSPMTATILIGNTSPLFARGRCKVIRSSSLVGRARIRHAIPRTHALLTGQSGQLVVTH